MPETKGFIGLILLSAYKKISSRRISRRDGRALCGD